jgi:spermidine/putrescine-binding protein
MWTVCWTMYSSLLEEHQDGWEKKANKDEAIKYINFLLLNGVNPEDIFIFTPDAENNIVSISELVDNA